MPQCRHPDHRPRAQLGDYWIARQAGETIGSSRRDGEDHSAGMALPRVTLPATVGPDVCLADLSGPQRPLHLSLDRAAGMSPIRPIGTTSQAPMARRRRSKGFAIWPRTSRELDVSLFGLSRQTTDYQREMVERLDVPFPILSDAEGQFRRRARVTQFRNRRRDLSEKTHAHPRRRDDRNACSIRWSIPRRMRAMCCDGSGARTTLTPSDGTD